MVGGVDTVVGPPIVLGFFPATIDAHRQNAEVGALPAEGGVDQPAVAVPEVERRIAGETVEITPTLHVGHPAAAALAEHDGQRMIVVRGVGFGQVAMVDGGQVHGPMMTRAPPTGEGRR